MNNLLNLNSNIIERKVRFSAVILDYGIDITSDIMEIGIDFKIDGVGSGFMILNDTNNNISNTYPLVGGERLIITIFSELSRKQIFNKVYVITDKKPEPQNLNIVNNRNKLRILFDSQITITNRKRKISKGYVGTKNSSEIVMDLLENELSLRGSKLARVYKSNTFLEDYVMSWNYPLSEIGYLQKISGDVDDKDFFLFYEDMKYFNFVPISYLMKQTPKFKLNRDISPELLNGGIPLYKIKNDTFLSGIDILQVLENNGLGSTYVYFDRRFKDIVESPFKFDSKFLDSIYTLGSYAYYKQSFASGCENSNYIIHMPDGEFADKYAYFDMRRCLFDIFKMDIELSGTLDLDVGNLVYIEFLNSNDKLDIGLTGNWMVTQLSLNISTNDESNDSFGYPVFRTNIVVSKDAYTNIEKNLISASDLIKTTTNINNNVINNRTR